MTLILYGFDDCTIRKHTCRLLNSKDIEYVYAPLDEIAHQQWFYNKGLSVTPLLFDMDMDRVIWQWSDSVMNYLEFLELLDELEE